MMAGRRLKVFAAQMGFFDTVVAAPSQAAALRAWGVRQNLFAAGDARIAQDEAAIAAALDHPGTPLRRPVGTRDPFEVDPKGRPAPPLPDSKTGAPTRTPSKAASRPARDRTDLDAAEAALRTLETQRAGEEAGLRAEAEALAARRRAAQAAASAALRAAQIRLQAARAAYRRAGGRV